MEWDDTWMAVAQVVSRRARCVVRTVGAVVVDSSNRCVGTGYNGAPAGYTEGPCNGWCPQSGGGDLCLAVHAELNALLYTERGQREGGTMYCTVAPCVKCLLAITNSGLSRLVCPAYERGRAFEGMWAMHIASTVGLEVTKWEE